MVDKMNTRPLYLKDVQKHNLLGSIILTLCLVLFSQLALANTVSVQTDRQNVEMGDIITLSIKTDFQAKGSALDLTGLKQNFAVLNQQQSNQIQIINGKYSSFTEWQIQILPKEIGNLTIPPIAIDGIKSKPYSITVKKAEYLDGNAPYFLEAEANKKQVHVQEQLIYTLRFYNKGSLINGNIRPPEFKNSLKESLKEQSVYGKTINGQQYTVYEWQYAVFPQSSGQLTINGPTFTGLIQLRGKDKGVQAAAKSTVVNVLPAEKSNAPYWLPAEDVTLTQKWENTPKTIQVGDSLRRIITLTVKGLKASQLPNITSQGDDNFKVYADEAKSSQTLSDKGVQSIKIISQAIVPTKAGTIHLPDKTITWWNTATKKFETAVLKSKPITVWPADGNQNQAIPATTDFSNNAKTPLKPNHSTKPYQAKANQTTGGLDEIFSIPAWVWPIIIAVILSILLLTLIVLMRTRKQLKELQNRPATAINTQTNAHPKTFNNKWCDMPLPEFYKELLRQLHDEFNIKSVDSINNAHLRTAIFDLEAHLFANKDLPYKTIETICDNWASMVTQTNATILKKGELNSLYRNG